MKTKPAKLNSFAVHPQLKSTYNCEEAHVLMNQGTTPASASSPTPKGPTDSAPQPEPKPQPAVTPLPLGGNL